MISSYEDGRGWKYIDTGIVCILKQSHVSTM